MATLTTHCANHPERPAIGVCMVTGQAICPECSTQYRGVNYSKEGLASLLADERARTLSAKQWHSMLLPLGLLLAPVALLTFAWLINLAGMLTIDTIQYFREL